MVVIVIVSLLVVLAATNLKGVIDQKLLQNQALGLVSALESASVSAVQIRQKIRSDN